MRNFRMGLQNKIAASLSRPKGLTARRGQVAVILIVVIAIGLVLFAASINLSLLSQSKTITMKAASASSSNMASMLASEGERLFREQLGGQIEKCSKSKGFGFLGLIFMIAIIIIAPYLGPAANICAPSLLSSAMVTSLQVSAAVGAVMELAAVVIAASIDPGISDMWNRQTQNLSRVGQFVERGIQTALQNAVTDQVKIPDVYDLDQDGVFGYQNNNPTQPKDVVSRFSLYNTKRFLDLPAANSSGVENFLKALHELVHKHNDDWGIWDPVFYPNLPTNPGDFCTNSSHACCKGVNSFSPVPNLSDQGRFPAECDVCCQYSDPRDVPAYCFAPGTPNNPITTELPQGVTQIGEWNSCASRSPFQGKNNLYLYPLIYDPSYEDSTNTFMSLREQLGRDDEHHLYHVGANKPNWHGDPINGKQSLADLKDPADQGFFLKDVVGHYSAPGFANRDEWISAGPPASPKLFPFLYKMNDVGIPPERLGWGAQLATLDYKSYQCHWCDKRANISCPNSPRSKEFDRLDLGASTTLKTYSGGWCVDNTNKPAGPPVVADNVRGLDPSVYVNQSTCAINLPTTVSNLNQYVGGWKPGSDQFCSPNAPYNIDCPKHGTACTVTVKDSLGNDVQINENCQCTLQTASQWPDDMIDAIIYGAPNLFEVEAVLYPQVISTLGANALAKTREEWYGDVAEWIEPPCPDPKNCPGSYTKKERPGGLWIWRAELQFLNKKIQTWLKPPAGQEYSSQSCMVTNAVPDAVWCVPPVSNSQECSGVSASEAATFDANNNSVRGDLYDVIQCLKWNAEDKQTYKDKTTAKGNAEKFQACSDALNSPSTCAAEAPGKCSPAMLPRSLVPAFYTMGSFVPATPSPDVVKFDNCLTSGTIQQCGVNCAQPPLPSGLPYNLPAFSNPNLTKITTIDNWCSSANSNQPLANACNGALMPNGVTTLTCASNKNICRCSWAGSCTGFAGCTLDSTYFNAVTDARKDAAAATSGSCSDQNFKNIIQQSADEAKIQVAKFKHRVNFLENRYNEAMSLANDVGINKPENGVLTTAVQKLTEFLDGDPEKSDDSPVEKFIQERVATTSTSIGDLPPFAIYVWQDADPTRLNPSGDFRWDTGEGYWHAVKVESRIPKRCTGNCMTSEWPKVVSRTSGGGFFSGKKICYRLEHSTGMTKTRVIRYDQDKDLRGLVFPGGQQIWDAKLSHPGGDSSLDPTGLRTVCGDFIDTDLAKWLKNDPKDPNYSATDPRQHLGAAFMLNEVPDFAAESGTPAGNYLDCWKKVHQGLLAHGVQSDSCAIYYLTPDGFRVKFAPCDNWGE